MNKQQYCLAKIAEECNEISVEALKICQFGALSYSPNDPDKVFNIVRFRNEMNDLLGALKFMEETCGIEFIPNEHAIQAKVEKMRKYLKISQELGYVAS